MKALALTGTVGSLLLSSLTAAPAPALDAPPSETGGTLVAARRAAAEGIRFGGCPAAEKLPPSVRCGTVLVPLDYADPGGRRIPLTVSRVRASGPAADRQGALVFNPGGPGASSTYFPLVAEVPEWKRISAAYDLVGYTPRGVGRSAPVSCQDPADRPKGPTPAPTQPSEVFKRERIARAKTYARGCAARTGTALRHYHSLNNARDLEVLRAALGEPRLTYMGASYGTYFGALYATLFPHRVRRMVFDAPVDPAPGRIWYLNNLGQSAAFERRWADFRTWVAKHDKVYGLGATAEEVRRSYEKVRAELAARPAGGRVGPGQLHAAMFQAGYHDGYWPLRAMALARYLKGDPKPLVEQAAPGEEVSQDTGNGAAVYTAVECNDAPWPEDFAVWDRDNTRLAKTAPFETWDNVWANLPCAYWKTPRQRPLDVRTAPGVLPPVLILAAERDAATPYAGALELQRRLSGAALVTERDAGTHGIGGGANACVNGYLESYLLTGAVPAAAADPAVGTTATADPAAGTTAVGDTAAEKTPVRRASCAPHPEPDPVSLDRRSELRPPSDLPGRGVTSRLVAGRSPSR
ncbi:alpha/beta fold hydrolase [Streptomyces sp. Je 1-79]|uniref:alpha/beta hydrolase n=1 Tax=Streptomyces sp. Je 1-79 TaxID=2943847 RepID=UPI0021A5459D|nr:alpha/beta hydrolase [Streptomyces sp. Je 1-79]MCT4352351.1 alpha/beta fold hydrolase [Streptomyces sp. Je 1-79]